MKVNIILIIFWLEQQLHSCHHVVQTVQIAVQHCSPQCTDRGIITVVYRHLIIKHGEIGALDLLDSAPEKVNHQYIAKK